MRIAHNLGLRTAPIDTSTFGGRKVIIVKRYDRIVDDAGNVERVHQEDFCQVMSLLPRQKYQEDGGPTLRRIATVLRESARLDSLTRLLQATFLNVMVGNGDAHAKNFSLLHHRDGTIELAPIYDVMSTLYYEDGDLAMHIDNVRKTSAVTRERLVNEAVSWGMRRESVDVILDELVTHAPSAIAAASAATPGLSPKIVAIVTSQLRSLTRR
jgi:serine/threonine-protein kinase HipA